MPNYEQAKIFLITPKIGTERKGFIGATTKNYLSSTLASCIIQYQQFKSGKSKTHSILYDLFDEVGCSNCSIVLIEALKCNSKNELNSKLFDIVNKTSNCINNNPAKLPTTLGSAIDEGIEQTEKDKKKYSEDNTHFVCSCGGRYTTTNKHQHIKTKIHNAYLKAQMEQEKTIETNEEVSVVVVDEIIS